MIQVYINDFCMGVIFLEPDKTKILKINFLKIYLDYLHQSHHLTVGPHHMLGSPGYLTATQLPAWFGCLH